MASEWFWNMAGTEVGPLSAEQLRAMVAAGRLTRDDEVKRGKGGSWVKASEVATLFPGEGPWASPGESKSEDLPVAVPLNKPAAKPKPAKAKPAEQAKPGAVREVKPVDLPVAQPAPARAAAVAKTARPAAALLATAKALPAAKPAAAPARRPATAGPSAAAPSDPMFIVTEAPQPKATSARADEDAAAGLAEKRKRRERMILYAAIGSIGAALLVGAIAWFVSQQQGDGGKGKHAVAQRKKAAEEDLEAGVGSGGEKPDPTRTDGGKTSPKPEPKTPEPKPAEKTPEKPGESKWVDAATGAAERGDVKVRIRAANVGVPVAIGPRGEQTATKEYLWLVLEVRNVGKKSLEYAGLGARGLSRQGLMLTDNFGKAVAPGYFTNGHLKGQVVTKIAIEPGEAVDDALLFQDPRGTEKGTLKHLRLQLPGAIFGQQAPLNFEIPAAMLKEVAPPEVKPDQPEAEPGERPLPKEAAKPKKKPEPGTPEADFGIEDDPPPAKSPTPPPKEPKDKEHIPGVN